MDRNFYVEVTLQAEFYSVLFQSNTLVDYQHGVDSIKHYVDYLKRFHSSDNPTMIGSFVCPYDSTMTIFAKTLINGELCYLGLKKFVYYGD